VPASLHYSTHKLIQKKKEKGTVPLRRKPKTSFNNRFAQRPKGKPKLFIIKSLGLGVFVSQAHTVI